ncbi:hypothetical protein MNBD_UNCLBAC01-1910 [hydrothermal vent metagenome]|uniref:Uncharacterized protein n=1 Tax=hydrothermal vent metagenome TaxID=652676 RepID=A0A3B1D0G3_9ZZZZ
MWLKKILFRQVVMSIGVVFFVFANNVCAEIIVLNSGVEYEGEIFEYTQKHIRMVTEKKEIEREIPLKMIRQIKMSTSVGVGNSNYVNAVSTKVKEINEIKRKRAVVQKNKFKKKRAVAQRNKLKNKRRIKSKRRKSTCKPH